jgi:DNA-binding transcriptional LysR family regulator
MSLPSLDSLRCLDAAAALGSFRAAAKAVSLTPAAVGLRIKQLEEQLGVQLFARSTRSIRLTQEGAAVLLQARVAIQAAEGVVRAARGDAAPVPFDYVIGTRHELGLSFLLPLRSALEAQSPGMTLHFYFSSGPDLVHKLRGRELDAALTSARVSDVALSGERVHLEEYVFVAAPRLLKRQPLAAHTDAVNHALLDIDAELPLFRYWRDAPGAAHPLQFGQVRRLGTIEAIRQLAVAGEGVAVLPRYLVERDLLQRRLVIVFGKVRPLSDHFRLLYRRDDPRQAIHQRVAKLMSETPLR